MNAQLLFAQTQMKRENDENQRAARYFRLQTKNNKYQKLSQSTPRVIFFYPDLKSS
jgi:hypothetical protein